MSIDSQIMAPCPGCGMVLPTDLVACTDCLATLPDALRERWAQVTGRHRDDTSAYLDARVAVRSWLRNSSAALLAPVKLCDLCKVSAPAMSSTPCCSSHGKDLCCPCYRRTHFVETGCTCCPDGQAIRAEMAAEKAARRG